MGRRALENIGIQSRTLRRRNISCVHVEEKKENVRKSKSKINKANQNKSCDVSSEFKKPAVVLQRIDCSYLNAQQRFVLGDKTNASLKPFTGRLGYINAQVSLKQQSMDILSKSHVRQSPRGSPCGNLSKQRNGEDGYALNETLANNSFVNISDAMRKSDISAEDTRYSSKTKTRGNVKPVENCQNVNKDLTRTLAVAEAVKEKDEDSKRVFDSQDSPMLRRRSSRQSLKESALSVKESSYSVNPSIQTKILKSSDISADKTVSHTCVYSKVPRDTLRNNCLPIEEKLALYEFEVDENEPAVKRKQKRKVYVKRKKRNLLDDPAFYCGATKAKSSAHDTRSKKVKECAQENHNVNAPKHSEKNVQDLEVKVDNLECVNVKTNVSPYSSARVEKSAPLSCRKKNSIIRVSQGGQVLKEVDNSNLCETPKSGGSRTDEWVRQRVMKDNLENCPPESPITRPGRRKTPLRKLRNLEEFSEFQADSSGNGSRVNRDLSTCEIQTIEYQNGTTIDTSISSPKISENNYLINKTNKSESCSKLTPIPTIASSSTPEKCNYVKTNEIVTEKEEFWSPIPAVQSPIFISVDKGDKTGSTINSSLNKSLSLHSIPLSRKVFILPRISGGGGNISSNDGPDKKWDVENCFGFNDSQEAEVLPFFKIPSANKFLSKQPFSSTPMNQRLVKPLPTRLNVKRKIEITSEEGSWKSPRLEDKKTENTLKSLAESTCGNTPFSNPLKQSKLNFTHESDMHSNRKVDHSESTASPKLFKDDSDDDKTPTHFTQPPRRSYNRLIRKNLKFVGDDWIEVDEDDCESMVDEVKSRSKRTKKNKLRKKEEKEASKWIEDFNSKCEEIEEFELCVE